MVAAKTQPRAPAPAPARCQGHRRGRVESANYAAAGAQATADGGALPTFRWPVRGKVITSYGAKTNGKSNDGINLAVPEGTPVKAAEDGVVAYSGNELKGYGNLVLVRHSNGYVTAYAHASELLVKRGDTIKRGQVIAKSGQPGEVGSPQLHFEIRKGSSPVDPLQFLNGAEQSSERVRSGDKRASPGRGVRCFVGAYPFRRTGVHFAADMRYASPLSLTPSRPARSCMNCQATRPEREPRVVDHSSASRSQLRRRRA